MYILWKYFVNDKVSVGSKIDGFLILLKGSFLKKKDKKRVFCCVSLDTKGTFTNYGR